MHIPLSKIGSWRGVSPSPRNPDVRDERMDDRGISEPDLGKGKQRITPEWDPKEGTSTNHDKEMEIMEHPPLPAPDIHAHSFDTVVKQQKEDSLREPYCQQSFVNDKVI